LRWTPAQLPGLGLWLDAADPDGDGRIAFAAESGLRGAMLGEWRDKSGQGRHFTAAANGPTYALEGMNGRPVARFTEAQAMALAGPSLAGLGASASMTSVHRSSDPAFMLLAATAAHSWVVQQGETRYGFGFRYDRGPFAGQYVQDGTPITTLTSRAQLHAATTGKTTLLSVSGESFAGFTTQQTLSGGGARWAGFNFTGDLSELVLTSQPLSLADRQLLEGYLAAKWGTQAALPADHPYRAARLVDGPAGVMLAVGDGNDVFDGGAGTDLVDFTADTVGFTITLTGAGDATVARGGGIDRLIDIENILGGTGDDTLTGSAEANLFRGGAGNDTLTGGGGADTADYATSTGAVYILLDANGNAANVADGLGFRDQLRGFANLIGGSGNDVLIGNVGANVLQGGAGDDSLEGSNGGAFLPGMVDTLSGGDGHDQLRGGWGDDVLLGGAGNDTLHGSGGANTLEGGPGDDVYTVG
jgi:Ca2+-binding RTX toxin-like protein